MTQKFLSLILPLVVLIFVSAANAQTTTQSAQTGDNASKLNQQLQLIREQKKSAVTQLRDEAKAAIAAKRDEFKTRVQTIKDQRKKVLVERIDAKLAKANKKQTGKFTEVLNRLQTFIDKAKESATDSGILAKITAAQTVIDSAWAAVNTKAAKSYTMMITDDATLKLNAGTVTSGLRQDLRDVYKLVIDAKQAVMKLKTDNAMMRKEATSSGKL